MAISQADLKVISTVFGKPLDELSGALSSEEEVSLDLRLSGKILSDEEQKNLRESAIKQGKEIGYKEIAKGLELELDAGEKEPSVIADKFKTNLSKLFEEKYKTQTPTDELISQAQKAKEWEEKYTKLFDTHKEVKGEVDEWKTKYTQKEQAIKEEALNNKILSSLPKDISMDKGDALLIIKNNLLFEENDGKMIIKKGDKAFTDPVGEPESLENVIRSFTEQKGWIKKEGGMGGGDRGGNNSYKRGLTAEQAHKYLIEKGIQPTSPEGLKLFRELQQK
jgi:chromosome segregation ATPase